MYEENIRNGLAMAVISMRPTDTSPSNILRITGAFVAIFSLVIGALVMFVLPGACSFVSIIQLAALSILFIFGVIAFLTGTAFSWKRKRG